jgi:dipeptidyl aminopeptidase/acylaminoacyl peptidase
MRHRHVTRPCSIAVLILACSLANGCQPPAATKTAATAVLSPQPDDLSKARGAFVTKLRVKGPAPQRFLDQKPPAGVNLVEYRSGDLRLKGWLSADPGDGKKRPAVVYLHGGWAFGEGDWDDAAPFVGAGYVLLMPMMRAENGNPGVYESFYGEVDDAVAAGKYVADLPYVDASKVFLAGHSVGAVLTCLTAMMPSPYKAAAALDGYVEMESWAAGSPPEHIPYDGDDSNEVRLRNPVAFAGSLRCPLKLYVTRNGLEVNQMLEARARQSGKECDIVVVTGDHLSMVAPSVKQAIAWFGDLKHGRK